MMKKIRLALVLVAALVLGVFGAIPSAPAAGDSCGGWSHPDVTKAGRACVFINTSIFGTTAKVKFTFSGNLSNNCIGYDFDYVRLVKASNGAILKANETDQGPSCVGITISTGQSFFCGDVQATARYRFRHSVGGPGFLWDGHSSGWVTRTSNIVGVCP